MITLISKVQYKNFETGEFIDEKQRTYEETIELIEKFPWNEQREKIVIDLTNPSITIEGINNDFLKLAVFFNEKFVLHYFDEEHVLYTKSFTDIREAYPYIKNYFAGSFDVTDLKKEITWMQHNLKHFVSQDFRYEVTPSRIKQFLISTTGFNFFILAFFIVLLLIYGTRNITITSGVFLGFFLFILGGGINLILFFNYYFYSKDKILVMSKGNDVFYYGDKNTPEKFSKKDILRFTRIKTRNRRSMINGFAIIIIEMKDLSVIKIPNLLVDSLEMENKLFEYSCIEEGGFPYLQS